MSPYRCIFCTPTRYLHFFSSRHHDSALGLGNTLGLMSTFERSQGSELAASRQVHFLLDTLPVSSQTAGLSISVNKSFSGFSSQSPGLQRQESMNISPADCLLPLRHRHRNVFTLINQGKGELHQFQLSLSWAPPGRECPACNWRPLAGRSDV